MFLKRYSMQIYPVKSIYVESHDMAGVFILHTHLFRFVLEVMSTFAEKKKKKDIFSPTPAFLLLVTHIQKGFS